MDNQRKLLRELGWKIQGVSGRFEGIWGKYREISNRRTRGTQADYEISRMGDPERRILGDIWIWNGKSRRDIGRLVGDIGRSRYLAEIRGRGSSMGDPKEK
jgi:hypothetical protein